MRCGAKASMHDLGDDEMARDKMECNLYFEEGMGALSILLNFGRNHGEEGELDGSADTVPPGDGR